MIGVLISLVLAFDLLCIYAKEFMGAPLAEDSVFSIGIAAALIIILIS